MLKSLKKAWNESVSKVKLLVKRADNSSRRIPSLNMILCKILEKEGKDSNMIYVVSDIHGRYDKYLELLEKIQFSEKDKLYVLGDVIDRGASGFQILLDMAKRFNVHCLMGNHEDMAIKAMQGIISDILNESNKVEMTDSDVEAMELWFYNGGKESFIDFMKLEKDQKKTVWEYMCSLLLYREVEVGNRKYVLVHGGLGKFSPDRPLSDYEPDEILWHRSDISQTYYEDKCVIHGHTPTQFLMVDAGLELAVGKIFNSGNYIDIDCGIMLSNGRLGCLCLDTMEEIYV